MNESASPLIDARGVRHVPATPPVRIACLVPSITELLFALDLNPIARTTYCIHPKTGVRTVPSVGGTKKINHRKLSALAPSHVILNIDENTVDMADKLSQYVPDIIVTHPLGPTDNIALYQLLGGIFDRRDKARQLCRHYTDTQTRLRHICRDWPPLRVLYLIWREPWMTLSKDTYIARNLAQINWFTIPIPDTDQRYPTFEITPELLAETDLVLFSTEPYRFGPTDLIQFAQHYRISPHKLALIDGEMTSWYGSRAIRGLEYLLEFGRQIVFR